MTRRLLLPMVLALTTAVLVAAHVSAHSPTPISDEHVQRIKNNCQAANRTLRQLHASDALLRVNRGQLYDLISTKLMARMNSRLALNKLDASSLVTVTADFDQALGDFRVKYKAYDEQMSATLRIDRRQKPVEYYYSVNRARELRIRVHAAIQNLDRYMGKYEQEFEVFRTNFAATQPEERS